MSGERETIIAHIMTSFNEVTGVALVTDNMRLALAAAPDELPAIAFVDLGDKEEAEENYPYGTNHCEMHLAALCVLDGSTEAAARAELGAFRDLTAAKIREQIYLCDAVDWFGQTGKSHVNFPGQPKRVCQGIEFSIKYLEQYTVGMTL